MLKSFLAAARSPKTLGQRALNASFWNVLTMGIIYSLRLAGNLIMTQNLAPEAFGLTATVTEFCSCNF